LPWESVTKHLSNLTIPDIDMTQALKVIVQHRLEMLELDPERYVKGGAQPHLPLQEPQPPAQEPTVKKLRPPTKEPQPPALEPQPPALEPQPPVKGLRPPSLKLQPPVKELQDSAKEQRPSVKVPQSPGQEPRSADHQSQRRKRVRKSTQAAINPNEVFVERDTVDEVTTVEDETQTLRDILGSDTDDDQDYRPTITDNSDSDGSIENVSKTSTKPKKARLEKKNKTTMNRMNLCQTRKVSSIMNTFQKFFIPIIQKQMFLR
jgi:hypothetical protein